MANLKIIFDATISKAVAAIDRLTAKDEEAKKKMAQPGPEVPDRRAALEEVKTAKVAAETAKREKLETQAAIKVQSAAVREAEAAVQAAQQKGESTAKATRELEKQRKELEKLKDLAKLRGQAADLSAVNAHQTRQRAREMAPKVNPAPAESAFSRILGAGKRAAAGVESRFQGMKSRLAGVFSGLRGVVAGALAVGGITLGISGMKKVIDDLDNLGKSSRNLNLTAEELQKFQYTANSVNFPVEQIQPSFDKMRKIIGDAVNGVPDAVKKLNLLGVSLEELKGKTTAEQFDVISGAILGIADPTEQATAAMSIFGEQGAKMLNFMREYQSAGTELAGRGGIISNEEVQAAEDFNQACTNIAASLRSWAVNSGFISQLKEAAELLDFMVSKKGERTEAEAAQNGVYTRATGTDYAIGQAEKSGNYSKEEIDRMKKTARGYKTADHAGVMDRDDFALIDRALKDAGLGAMARTNDDIGPFADNWSGSAETATVRRPPGEQDPAVAKAKKEREERQKKEAEREARRKEAKEKLEREKAQKLAVKLDDQLSDLDRRASGKSDDKEERRRAYIETEAAKAERAARDAGTTLAPARKQKVEEAAGKAYDAEESRKTEQTNKGIEEEITALEEKYNIQQLINSGKAREAAIQAEINKEEKSARAAGTELTDDDRARISSAAGKSFDDAARRETSHITGPVNQVYSDSLLRMGGIIGSVGNMASTDYTKRSSQTLDHLEAKMNQLYDKIPNRTETGEDSF